MKALVLSGGGAKGSYQIGVWKALKKLHIKIDIVTGTSSGAINGALITQNSFFRALKVWKTLTYEKIIGKEFELKNKNDIYKTFIKNFINKKGTNVEKLQQIIYKYLKTNKIYRSKINYGLVTYNVTTRKVEELEKKDLFIGEKTANKYSTLPIIITFCTKTKNNKKSNIAKKEIIP